MNNNENSRKDTMKKLALSAAMMNVLLASNVSVAAAKPVIATEEDKQVSFEVTSTAGAQEVEWFDSGCVSNSGCGAT
ncbi:hypothetical protein [Bdellovibrio reynosensis]|uniref:Uncharacterized protein n=1 Tax=Bdellovibrio reynosensis TaxID=2835041 RepID=A0ABY4C525_9BACT|nr:hypothetical protein [Bdellovibrio reynosensis]UOE99999.1 hypothetical protein MNR06_09835 [Bdellovibrio reynosensis]